MRSSFSYTKFVKQHLENNAGSNHPSEMLHSAINAGAPHHGDELRKKVSQACESIAGGGEVKRVREKGVKGYSYTAAPINDDNSAPR